MTSNMNNALLFLVDTLFGLYIIAVMLRFILQAARGDFFNPIAQFLVRVTDPVLRPLRHIIPRWGLYDMAAVVLMLVLAFLNIEAVLFLIGMQAKIGSVIVWSVFKLLVLACNLYFFSILVQAILSWFSPGMHSQASVILWDLNEPLLRPVRQVLPPMGGLDFSPLVVLIALQVINMLIPLPGLFR